LDFNKECLPSSVDNFYNEMTAGFEPMNGTDIFFNKETKKSSLWAVQWSDLMMTMFILFCVLYAYSSTKSNEVQVAPKEDLSRLYEKSRETLKAKNFNDITSVELTDDKAVKIILPGDILFDIGQAEIKTSASGSLAAVGELLKDKNYAITVAGHTDSIPIRSEKFPSNWELSTARACSAANFLIEEMDIPPNKIQVIGYAEYRPIESNETPEGRSVNRRVEVIISKNQIKEQIAENLIHQ
jgi:flagellar motor protein MotB